MQKRLLSILILLAALTITSQGQDYVSDLLGRVNGLRASLGLAPYTINGALAAAAQNHAQWMVETGQVSHIQNDGSTPSSRAAAAGYPSQFVTENMYGGGMATPDTAWSFWVNSSIHYTAMTNAGFTEIGIASATADWGTSYVLVFGSPVNPYGENAFAGVPAAAANPGAAAPGGGDIGGGGEAVAVAAAPPPPPFVRGLDANGNIMHEIQPGHTVGDIALIYGYSWEDVPLMLQINSLTTDDVRNLQEGGIFLVPPINGTFTPTAPPPGMEPTATVSPTLDGAADYATLTTDQLAMLMATSTPMVDNNSSAAAAPVAADTLPPAALQAPAASPEVTQVAALPTVNPNPAQMIVVREGGTSPILIVAVVVQVLIVGIAGFEFIRRNRRK